MIKRISFFLILLTFVGCNSEPEISCSTSNQEKLLDASKQFIIGEIEGDSKSEHINFSNFKIRPRSCYAQKRSNKVKWRLTSTANEANRKKTVTFDCYFKAQKKGSKTICQMR